MMTTRFRILVVIWIVMYVWLFTLPWSTYKQPPDVREALAYCGRGAVIPLNATGAYLILGAFLAAGIGLLAWQNWARRFLVCLLFVWVVLRGLRGIAVTTSFGSALSTIFTLLTGMIVVLMYTEPLALKFAPTGSDQAPLEGDSDGQTSGAGDEDMVAVCETDNGAEVRAISALLASAGVHFITSDEGIEEQIQAGQISAEGRIGEPVRFLVRAQDADAARAVLSVFRLSGR